MSCYDCHLSTYRRNVVEPRIFGKPEILFISDYPGRIDDMTGFAMSGPEGKTLCELANDAGILDNYAITHCCRCRPCDAKLFETREPTHVEVLACMPNLFEDIDKMQPKKIILLGKLTARYYAKQFNNSLKIIHPSVLLKTGRTASQFYLSTLRALKEFLDD